MYGTYASVHVWKLMELPRFGIDAGETGYEKDYFIKC